MPFLMDKWFMRDCHLHEGLWVEQSTVTDWGMINVSANSSDKHTDQVQILKD